MKSKLVKKILYRLTMIGAIPLLTSYNTRLDSNYNYIIQQLNNLGKSVKKNSEIYLPLEKKLRSIEQEKYDFETNNCKHKACKFHEILKENGEISYLISGWIPDSKNAHLWLYVLNKETNKFHLIDPTWETEKDGLLIKDYPKIQLHYIFNKNAALEDVNKDINILKAYPLNIGRHNRFVRRLKRKQK